MIKNTYCGYISCEERLRESASGGIATAMSEQIVKSGGVVYGVSYYPLGSFKDVAYIRVSTTEEINLLKSSKYIGAKLNRDILNSIVVDLKGEKTVLFIGLPCDVFAVKNYIKKANVSDEKLISVDLICRGPTYPAVAKDFIDRLEKKNKSRIIDFNVRYKNPYWKPPYLYAKFENGKEYVKPFYETNYGIAFLMMPLNKCYECKNKGDNHVADITIGDHWGTSQTDEGYNKFGSSVAFVYTDKGDEFVRNLENFVLSLTDTDKAIKANCRYDINVEKTTEMESFKADFEKRGLSYAVSKHMSFEDKAKRIIKDILRK